MSGKPSGYLRAFVDFAISGIISLPVSIGLPYLFWRLLDFAVARNNTGGGMFWMPSYPDELLWILCWLLVTLPYFIGLIIVGVPIGLLMNNLGLHINSNLKVPVPNGALTIEGNTLVAGLIALAVQVVLWAIAIHLARSRFKRLSRAGPTCIPGAES